MRRNFFIERLNRIPECTPTVPKGIYTVAQLPVENAEEFCKWCLTDFYYTDSQEEDKKGPEPDSAFTGNGPEQGYGIDNFIARNLDDETFKDETMMMETCDGFYDTKGLGLNQVRMAYVLKIKDLERALTVLEKALQTYHEQGHK